MSNMAQLTAVFQLGNGKNATVHLDFHKRNQITHAPTDWSAASLTAIAQAAYNGWSGAPNLRRDFNPQIKFDHAEAYAYDFPANPSPPPAYHRVRTLGPYASTGAPAGGTDPVIEGTLPPQVAMVVSFHTALLARTGRGRCYLPPCEGAEADNTGHLQSGYNAQLQADFDNWVVGIQNAATPPDEIIHAVMSLKAGAFNLVTERVINPRLDTQRRRLTRV